MVYMLHNMLHYAWFVKYEKYNNFSENFIDINTYIYKNSIELI